MFTKRYGTWTRKSVTNKDAELIKLMPYPYAIGPIVGAQKLCYNGSTAGKGCLNMCPHAEDVPALA